MEMYGLTVVNSAGEIIAEDMHGNRYYRESITKLFVNEQGAIDYALSIVGTWFETYGFENGTDQNDKTLEDLSDMLRSGENIVIQASDEHCEFNFFVQDMPGIVNRNDYIATKMWSEEDVRQSLVDKGFAGTEDQVADVINTGCLRALGDCNDDDWAIIDNAISNVEENLIEENPDILVTGINWDVDRNDFDSDAEYEAILLNALPEKVVIPFKEFYGKYGVTNDDAITDYLTDTYDYCVNSIGAVKEVQSDKIGGNNEQTI